MEKYYVELFGETNEDIFESKPIEDGNNPSDKAEYISKEKIKKRK